MHAVLRFTRIIVMAAPLAIAPAIVSAQQDYPAKPIRVIVPFPAGGSADLVARTVGQKFNDNTKQPFIVENRAGADTIIAMDMVKNAPADGYTVGYAIGSALTMNPTLYTKLPYDPVKDYVPVMVIANVPLALVVHPSIPANNVQELAALIKAKPGEIFYGQANIVAKIATEAFSMAAGGKMTEIAYKGSTPNVQALLVGEVKVSIEPVATVLPHVQAGKLRALAVTDSRRSAAFPDLPTIAEAGISGYAFNNWHAIIVPAGTPKDIVTRLHAEITKAARHPDVAAKVQPLGVEIVAGTPDELQKRVATEREHWAKQIKAMGIRLD
ncbi:MAG: Bug family tripartite tricarboxylate transporter substrate binding protein [Burkholderiales bacterium]